MGCKKTAKLIPCLDRGFSLGTSPLSGHARTRQRPRNGHTRAKTVARLRRNPGSKGVSWAAGRMASVPRTREACLSPRCLMATAASLLPSFLPAFVPCVCLPPRRLCPASERGRLSTGTKRFGRPPFSPRAGSRTREGEDNDK